MRRGWRRRCWRRGSAAPWPDTWSRVVCRSRCAALRRAGRGLRRAGRGWAAACGQPKPRSTSAESCSRWARWPSSRRSTSAPHCACWWLRRRAPAAARRWSPRPRSAPRCAWPCSRRSRCCCWRWRTTCSATSASAGARSVRWRRRARSGACRRATRWCAIDCGPGCARCWRAPWPIRLPPPTW